MVLPLLPTKIAFERPATRLELLLPELSKAVGEPLRVSAGLRDERLVVAWHDRPAADLLKAVAEVCAAEWQRDEQGLKLLRPPATERRLAQEALALRIDAAKKDLAARKPLPPLDAGELRRKIDGWYRGERDADDLDNDGNWNQMEARESMFEKGPVGRLTERAIRLLPPERYADVVGLERRTFSTRPTRAQERLGAEFEALLAGFCRESDAMVSASKGVRRKRQWSGDPTTEERTFSPSTLVLEIEATPYAGMRPYEFHVKVRKAGDPTFVATGGGVVGSDEASWRKVVDPTPYTAVKPPARTKAERLDRTRRPDLFDPMADLLLDLPRLASLRRRDLVARVDDAMGRVAPFLGMERNRKGLTVGAAFSRLLGEEHGLRDDGSTLLVSVLDEPTHRRQDCRRDDLRALVAAAEREGFVSLDSAAAFAQRNGKSALEGLGRWSVGTVRPGSETSFGNLDPEALRLYGALSPTQRAAVLTNRRVPIMELGPVARAQATRLIFKTRGHYDHEATEWVPQASQEAASEFDRMPAGAYLAGGEATEPIMYAIEPFEGREYRNVQDTGNIGQGLGLAEGNGKPYDPATAYTRVVPGTRRRVTLKIVLDSKRSETLVLKEDRFPVDPEPVGWMELPASFRQAVRAKADAQAKAMREYRSDRKGSASP